MIRPVSRQSFPGFASARQPYPEQRIYEFRNGYGASVINHGYGAEAGLFELAVLDSTGTIVITPIADDVIGWLSEAKVQALLREISKLPKQTRKRTRQSVVAADLRPGTGRRRPEVRVRGHRREVR